MENNEKNEQVYLYFEECDNLKQNVYNHKADDQYYELLRDYQEVVLESIFRR